MPEQTGKSFSKLQARLAESGKKGVLAMELGMSESQFSKLIHGQAPQLCRLLDLLGLDLVDREYLGAVELVLREKLK